MKNIIYNHYATDATIKKQTKTAKNMGAKKKPIELKILHGTNEANKDRLEDVREIPSPKRKPNVPKDLTEIGVEIWRNSLDFLMLYNVYQEVDYHTLAAYCREWDIYHKAIWEIQNGAESTNYSASGQPHPMTVKNQCLNNIKIMRSALGLSYDVRSRLPSGEKDEKADAFNKLIKKTG